MAQLDSLMRQNFIEYASYSILDRAIPDVRDGLKPVQRRILHTLFEMHDGRFHKVANVIGETMKLHPHGDASIGSALVVLANKEYFIERQGNFGSVLTGHPAAAARYIECRLTPLALATLFDPDLTEFSESYDGRSREPECLPAKLPVALMLGAEGIAVGMTTRILSHNAVELWRAQIALLNGESARLYPDFRRGGMMDVSGYDDGKGKVEIRARIEALDEKRVVIREIPSGTTTETVIASIEAASQKGRVKVASINDFTTDEVEIELKLSRGVDASEVIPQLFAYTECSVTITSNIVVVRGERPVRLSVSELLADDTDRLCQRIRAELEWEQSRLADRKHWLTLEQIFVEERVYKRIEKAGTEKNVRNAVISGMKQFQDRFVRPMVDDDVRRLLELRIRRISAYDIEKNRAETAEIDTALDEAGAKLADLTETAIAYLEELIAKFGADCARRTEISDFETIEKKAVARQTIKLGYDPDTGFFGSSVKGGTRELLVSEFDLVLGICGDGSYRIMTPPEKVLLEGKVVYLEIFDPELGLEFTVVYRDRARNAFGKRARIDKFIRNREYELIKDKAGKIDVFLPGEQTGVVSLAFVPAPRQRVRTGKFDLGTLQRMGAAARGVRLAPKPVSRVKLLARSGPKPRRRPGSGGRARQARLF
ncbi:MAG: DNA topoisomerase IV subunit A [Myxococcota bacterium]